MALIAFFAFSPTIIENNREKIIIYNEPDFISYLDTKKIKIDNDNLLAFDITLPKNTNAEYNKYCDFLKSIGFNLKLYLGSPAKIFIGTILDNNGSVINKEIHIITVEDKIVGENIVDLKSQEYEKIK